jgi:hypothetical protein
MKKLNILNLISGSLIILGAVLITGGNHIGDYMVVIGAISGTISIVLDAKYEKQGRYQS